MFYSVSLLRGYITHLSPRGTLSEPQSTKNTTKVTTFYLVGTFIGKEGNSPLQNCIYQVLCSRPTLSASRGNITHLPPRKTPTEPQIYQKYHQSYHILLSSQFIGKEWNSPFKIKLYQFLFSRPTLSASWGVYPPSLTPQDPIRAPNLQKIPPKSPHFT